MLFWPDVVSTEYWKALDEAVATSATGATRRITLAAPSAARSFVKIARRAHLNRAGDERDERDEPDRPELDEDDRRAHDHHGHPPEWRADEARAHGISTHCMTNNAAGLTMAANR